MRALAPILILLLSCAPAARAQTTGAPQATNDPAYTRFEQAIDDAKSAMMADPEGALPITDRALAIARALPPSTQAEVALATAEWLKGEALIRVNTPKKAAPVIDAALARASRYAPNQKLQGDLMRSRGAIATFAGDYVAAMRDSQRAYGIFRAAGVKRSQAIALQDIGQIYSNAGDYARALEYYSQASELYDDDPGFRLSSHNNRAEVLRLSGRYEEAEREFAEAVKGARELESPLLETQILANMASAQIENKKLDAAGRTIAAALRLSRSGEAAGWKPMVFAAQAKLRAARGDYQGAANLLRQTFAGRDLTATDIQYMEFHELAAKVFEKLGDKDMALAHLKAFQRLDSESRKLTATVAAQLMAARFDYNNQKQKIFERDAHIKQQQAAFRTRLLLGLVGATMLVLVLLLVSALRIRKSRNETRAANVVLNSTNTALEKALKAKTEFLATTSHEIRTPLNGILGMTQILLTNRNIDAEAREQVQVVHGAGEAMRALVDDILDVAKMETGEVSVLHEPLDFRRIVEESARLWSGHAAAKGLALELDIADAPRMIRSDGARLRQILGNLLSNAVKFTPAGSVILRSRADDDAGTLIVEIEDTGIGIPADHMESVFEAFHQVDGGMARQFSGTGLGLSICRSLALALGGDIALASECGKGSTFTVRIPLDRVETTDSAKGGDAVAPTTLADARLLLVESNAMTEGVMRSILEPAAGSVDCVPSASAAIDAVRACTVDHVLVEGKSAAGEGEIPLEALAALVACCNDAGVALTILFAPSEALPLGDVAALGASQIVVKPVGGAQLVETLRSAYGEASQIASAA